MQELINQFVREKQFLRNVTPKTVRFLYQSMNAFTRSLGDVDPNSLDRARLNEFVVKMRESGLRPVSCNTYISGVNSFLTWLFENGHTPEHLKVKQLKEEKKVIQPFKDEHLKALLSWKPNGFYEWRLHALVCLIIDSGVRIEEALTLELSKVDLNNLLLTIYGKGSKERIVPMSLELRKVFWRYLKLRTAPGTFLFCTSRGNRLSYDNSRRDFQNLCEHLGITDVRCSFHTLRHTFAYKYAQSFARLTGSAENGIFHLQRQLGHESLTMTRRYVELQPEDLRDAHIRASIMNSLKQRG